jgi:hypothetical protein
MLTFLCDYFLDDMGMALKEIGLKIAARNMAPC